jgi:hypothetical protein
MKPVIPNSVHNCHNSSNVAKIWCLILAKYINRVSVENVRHSSWT